MTASEGGTGPSRPAQAGSHTRISPASATLWLIAVSTVLRCVMAATVGLGIGESYYFGAARHLQLSYFDQPPATAFLAWLGLHLTGVTNGLVLRAPFILVFSGTTWLMFLVGRRLFGAWPGFWAALLLNLTPGFALSTGLFLQPEAPLMFFWLATVYALSPLLVGTDEVPHPDRQWMWAGGMLGLALLSKYTSLFLAMGAGAYLLAYRDRRFWLTRRGPYLAAAVAALCLTPVLVWNSRHQWVSFLWQGERGVNYHGIHLNWLLHNVAGQAAELLPWIWLALVVEAFRAIRGPAEELRTRRFLVLLSLPPILAFSAVAAYAPIGDHFHWGMPGYLTLLIGLGATVQRWLDRGGWPTRIALGALAALSVAFMVAANVQTTTGRFTTGYGAVSRWLAAGNDATIELIDYDELNTAFRDWGLLDRPDLFVFADRWYLGGKVDYALRDRLPFLLLNSADPREYAFFDSSARWVGHEGILVSRRDDLAAIRADYGAYCSALDPLGPVPIHRSGRVEVTLYVYRCTTLLRPYPTPYG